MNENLIQQFAQLTRVSSKPFRLEDYLFDKQLAFVLDPAPFKDAVTTRRAGKTISCVADLTYECTSNADVICLYITLSRKNAKRLIWPEFKKLNTKYQLGGTPNESDLSITYPNGSVVYLLGAKDRKAIEDFRGLPIKKVYLDESQSFPEYIKELIDDVLGPALMDHAGSLCLIGTPGPIPSGYFFDVSRSKEWSHHTWSFFDNPRLPFLKRGITHQDMLNRELKRRGVTMDDPSIQREWFGQWKLDENSLVFKYDASKNDYATPQPISTYILGVDLGYDDADAIALLGYGDSHPYTYLIDEKVTRKQGITELVDQIEEYRKKFEIAKIVMDAGGLGKKIAEEITRRHQIPIQAAEKQRKHEYIKLLNDSLRTGKLLAKKDSVFAQDCRRVEWDLERSTPDRRVISDRYHSDICDAVLYAWRESYSFTHRPEAQKPKPGTSAYFDALAEELETQAEEHFRRKEELDKEGIGNL